MTEKSFGFVGGGRIVRILLGGWKRAGRVPSSVIVSDSDATALDRLKVDFPSVLPAPKNNAQPAAQDLVFLAVHPPALDACLREIKGCLQPKTIVVSLAPKWNFKKLSECLGGFNRFVRMIPNAPSIVNEGYNPICFSGDLPEADREETISILEILGECPLVGEEALEAYAIVTSMGPTYFWYQLYQLQELGCDFGLSQDASQKAVSSMMHGALSTMTDSNLTKDLVLDLIPTKPLSSIEETVKDKYTTALGTLYEKLRGKPQR